MYHIRRLFVLSTVLAAALGCATPIYPNSLTTSKGSTSTDQKIAVLQTYDQSGSEDKWDDYVEFYSRPDNYEGIFNFDVSSVAVADVTSYALNVNYKGPKNTAQVWQFEFVTPSGSVPAGNNAMARNWKWSNLTLVGTAPFAEIENNGQVQLKFSSLSAVDNCDIDYLELALETGVDAPSDAPTDAPEQPTDEPTEAPTEEPTEEPTQAPTEDPTASSGHHNTPKPTQAPTQKPTKAPTQAPTKKPTSAPTSKPTKAPTSAPTKKPTTAPTSKPTTAPTSKPTTAPTSKPTKAPTQAPTQAPTKPGKGATSAPTSAPSSSSGSTPVLGSGRVCAAGSYYQPGTGTTWQWQLTGKIDTTVVAQMYDIDMFDSDASLIATLHSLGRAVTCYIDTAYEPGRPDSSSFTSAVLGNGIDGWPGQKWVDIRSTVVRNIMVSRIQMAAAKGCDAVEMDDVDSYQNDPGFPLTAADQANFNEFLAATAHANDLGVALKNDVDQISTLEPFFDFAINEECFDFDECDGYSKFTAAGKAVFGAEYNLATSKFCSQANADKYSFILKDLDLTAKVTQCCPTCSGTFTCVSSGNAKVQAIDVEESSHHSSAAQVAGSVFAVVIALFAVMF